MDQIYCSEETDNQLQLFADKITNQEILNLFNKQCKMVFMNQILVYKYIN